MVPAWKGEPDGVGNGCVAASGFATVKALAGVAFIIADCVCGNTRRTSAPEAAEFSWLPRSG